MTRSIDSAPVETPAKTEGPREPTTVAGLAGGTEPRKSLEYGALLIELVPFAAPFYLSLLVLVLPHGRVPFNYPVIWSAIAAGTVLFLAVCFVPWDRLPSSIDSLGPLAFFLVLAALRHGTGGSRSTLTVLVLLPLVWVALRGTRRQVFVGLVFGVAFFVVPILIWGAPTYPASEVGRALMWVLVSGVLALTVQLLVTRERERADDLLLAHHEQALLVDEARQTSVRLDEERRMVRAVVNTVDVGIAACDVHGTLMIVNDAVRDMTGAPADAGADFLLQGGLTYYEQDGTTVVPHERNPLLRALKGEVVRSQDNVVYDVNTGKQRWMSSRARALRSRSGKLTGAVVVIRDVTSRIETQREIQSGRDFLASLLDAVTEQAIIGTDRDGTVLLFNSGAENMLGIRTDDAVGKLTLASWHDPGQLTQRAIELGLPEPDDGQQAAEVLIATARDGGTETLEWTLIRSDGRRIETSISVNATRSDAGELTGFLGVVSDITARREAERLKDEFIAMVSHELRTPLSSIIGYLEVLTDDPDAEYFTAEQARYLSVVDRNARRLLRLVGDLLFAAQVEAGKVSLRISPTDLSSVVRASIDSATPKAKAARISLKLQIDSELPRWSVDPDRIGQAVDNLVGNALKFTPADGTITIRLAEQNGAAVIDVSDTGIGINPQDRLNIFERFYRSNEVTKAAIPGIGLGLAISLAIAEAHNGSLTLLDAQTVGTTFRLELPASAALVL